MKRTSLFRMKIVSLIAGGLLLGTAACSGKPDLALCGQYYRHLLQLQQSSHAGILAAMKTSQGKDAIIDYCLALEKRRVECVLGTAELGSANQCETGAEAGMFDGFMQRFDQLRN